MKEYHGFHLSYYVWLLFDEFQKCRNTYIKYCRLDCIIFFEQFCIKMGHNAKNTKNKLELIPDIDMYQFFKRGMRHVISYISQRHMELITNICHPVMLANQLIII